MILKPQEAIGDILDVSFLHVKVGYPVPSPDTPLLCPSPKAVVSLFVDDSI
jgi:hypothetical protein